jgi:hypothetical protein
LGGAPKEVTLGGAPKEVPLGGNPGRVVARAKGGPGFRPAACIRATGVRPREPLAGERSADEIRKIAAGLK